MGFIIKANHHSTTPMNNFNLFMMNDTCS